MDEVWGVHWKRKWGLYKRPAVIGRLWLKLTSALSVALLCHPNTNQPFIRALQRCGRTQISPGSDQMGKRFSCKGHMMEKHMAVRWHHRLCHISCCVIKSLFYTVLEKISKPISGGFLKFVCCTKQQIDVRVRSLCPLEIWDGLFQQWAQEWWTEVECFSQDAHNLAQIMQNCFILNV